MTTTFTPQRQKHASRPAFRGEPFAAVPPPGLGVDSIGRQRRAPAPWLSSVLIVLAAVGMYVTSSQRDYLLGQVAVPFLAMGVLHGLWRGGLRKILMLSAMIAVAYGAAACVPVLTSYIGSAASPIGAAAVWLVMGLTAIVFLLLVGWLGKSLRRRIILPRAPLRIFDRFVGMTVGLAEGGLVVLAMCWTVVAFGQQMRMVRDHRDTAEDSQRYRVACQMIRLAEEAERGTVGELVQATNIFDRIPALREAIDGLNRTGKLDLQGLDPETVDRLNQLLQRAPAENLGNLGQVIEQYKSANEARTHAYQQLPQPRQPGSHD